MSVLAQFCRTSLQVAVAFLLSLSTLVAQSTAPKPTPMKAPAPVKPKLTPAQQRGLKLLKDAEAEAHAGEPEVRAYVLWQLSRGYSNMDPVRSDSYLKEAFSATLGIEGPSLSGCAADECHPRAWLQSVIIGDVRDRNCDKGDLGKVKELMDQAEPGVQRHQRERLIGCYLDRKDTAHARELITEAAASGSYPYQEASDLMAAISDSGERAAIFSEALHSYSQLSEDNIFGFDDLGTMVFRFWRELPEPLVTQAIDEILRRAEDMDEAKQQPTGVHLGTSGGDVSVNSMYEYRLFELLPVIEAMDQSRAESLLNENASLRGLMHQYPKGLGSLAPNYYSDKPRKPEESPGLQSIGFNNPDTSAEALKDQQREAAETQLRRKSDQIQAEVSKDPQQALSDALTLPLQGPYGEHEAPRANALHIVMSSSVRSNPGVAKSAAAELGKAMEGADIHTQALILPAVAETYLRLGDTEGAKVHVKSLLKLAEKVYASDTDSDDPNVAFVGSWPSTTLWRRTIALAYRISPAEADKALGGIPDPNIVALETVTYGNILLGVQPRAISVMDIRKNGSKGMMMLVP